MSTLALHMELTKSQEVKFMIMILVCCETSQFSTLANHF